MYFVKNINNYKLIKFLKQYKKFVRCSFYSTIKNIQNIEIEKLRNIGILAHIDAGKTTTTERMLYYAGLINNMGEVHHGNTVTDYMDQERERGITITSAAISFYWKKNQFNLIDTPGHIDFTMEVEQTLRVMDGAVVVLDGSAGVEAQTLTVWRQAEKYKVPKIIYVNKMDRSDANIKATCNSIEKKLENPHLLLQLPVSESGKFVGIIDILTLELLNYGTAKEKTVNKFPITEEKYPKYWTQAKEARARLVDKLTEFDDELANNVIKSNSLDVIPTADIVKALKNVTIKQVAIPVLLGSSYKNIGVQSLMDAVILYLPSPIERNRLYLNFDENLCARAFKVIHDDQKGPLVFFRLYNGKLKKGQRIYNMKGDFSEQAGRTYMAFADEFKEVDVVDNGNIAVVSGLKKINAGDIVTSSTSCCQKAIKNIIKNSKEEITTNDVEKLLGLGISVPKPVFFCSIEPPGLHAQTALDQALLQLQREDPSLRVTNDAETGQTVLSGMGELHLEIIKDRIKREYKIDVDLGPLQIAYCEVPTRNIMGTHTVETKIGTSKQSITVKMSLLPYDGTVTDIKELLKLDKTPDYASNIANIFPKHLVAIRQGVEVGLSHGPKIHCRVINTQIMLHYLEVGKGTSETMVAATATQLIQKLLKEVSTSIHEPVMHLEIVSPEEHLSVVLADLSGRRTVIVHVGVRGNSKIVLAKSPLSELLGYATVLRTLTSGTSTFTMEFCEYRKMSRDEEIIAIEKTRGF